MTALALGIIALAVVLLIGSTAAFVALAIRGPKERRDWPARVRRDYEIERVRDNLFDRLTVDDIAWLKSAGWQLPPEVARRWAWEAHFRATSRMSPAELDALAKMVAAGLHVTAHPDDLRFDPFEVIAEQQRAWLLDEHAAILRAECDHRDH